jgi:AraC family transcriptional regulator
MKVAVDAFGSIREPYIHVRQEQTLCMLLRPGSVEFGRERFEMKKVTYDSGDLALCPRYEEMWMRTEDLHVLSLSISDQALKAASYETSGEVELRPQFKFADARLGALVAAVHAEMATGFSSGSLFLDSIEQAVAVALVDRYAVRHRSVRKYKGGLGPSRMRRISELVDAKAEDELTLLEMAQSVELSTAHFSRIFRKSTGESPHQFVLRHRIERAKAMLRAAGARVLDVAVACGFKSQQHFARAFRHLCGVSPTEYRQELLRGGDRYLEETSPPEETSPLETSTPAPATALSSL